MNHLKQSKSLYLQQHAQNPIDWYPWSEEAFAKAIKEDKPVFLSIGYSACHYCHLMNTEAFSNEKIAKQFNDYFINIKVDREEHPEVDMLYLQMAQAIMGQPLGWPLNLFLTPEKKPFFAFSYLPAFPQEGYEGSLNHLNHQIHQLWVKGGREEIETKVKNLVEVFSKIDEPPPFKTMPGNDLAKQTYNELMTVADKEEGGLLPPPKFPSIPVFRFLLKMGRFHHMTLAKEHVFLTLKKMAKGSLYDHVEDGFFRYCIDEKWSIPHFEKMAEDQAQIALCFIEAWQANKDPFFSEIAMKTLKFCMLHFVAEDGGVYTSMDSDSAGKEGAYYTFTLKELQSNLTELQFVRIKEMYLSEDSKLGKHYILHQTQSLASFARQKGEVAGDLKPKVKEALQALTKIREKRKKPTVDKKKITYLVALFGKVFLLAWQCFDDKRYLDVAMKNFDYIQKVLFHEGNLYHMVFDTKGEHLANLLDWACCLDFLTNLASVSSNQEVLALALQCADSIRKYFSAPQGGFYFTDVREKTLIVRKREYFDSSLASAQAILAGAFQKISALSGEAKYEQEARLILLAAGPFIEKGIPFFGILGSSMLQHALTTITAPEEKKAKVLHELGQNFFPEVIFIPQQFALESMKQSMANYKADEIVLCKKGKCLPPIKEVAEISSLIEGK